MSKPGRAGEGEYCFQEQVTSLCPECLKTISGVVRETSLGVVMEKFCPDHGSFEAVVSSDLGTYEWLCRAPRKRTRPSRPGSVVDQGCPDDCGLCPSHDQHTCLAILEINSRCDLNCPVCLADSLTQGHDLELPVVESALKKLIRSEGRVSPLQLSGGEPTLHPDLTNIVRQARSLGFTKIELDTNGMALGRDPDLAEILRGAGLSGVYLQMDGLSPLVSEFIRGKDLVGEKLDAIENCKKAGLQVVLSVTVVPGVNDHCLWEMIRFGMEQRLTGVNFQAMTLSGRFPKSLARSSDRFTPGHFMQKIEEQSKGKLLASDFTPIPCPDPRCGLMTYALIQGEELVPLKRSLGEDKLFGFVADMSDWETLIRQMGCEESSLCGCSCSLTDLANSFRKSDFFSVGYHGMMDAGNFDLERVRRCCVHELTSDGKLIPFCLYNIKYRQNC